jgi:hypothetical protein
MVGQPVPACCLWTVTPRRWGEVGDYLLALAKAERAVLVSGDQHLLTIELPTFTPRASRDAPAQP